MGPDAKPRTKRLVPKTPISRLTEKEAVAEGIPAAKRALSRDATNVPMQTIVEM